MKKWKLYTLTNMWTGRVYIGVTSLEDPLLRAEQHLLKETNAELYDDLRAAGLEQFFFRVVRVFETDAEAFAAEQESIQFFIAHVGPYGLYNRREGGRARFFGNRLVLPPFIRESLLAEVRRGPDGKTMSERTQAALSRRAFARKFPRAARQRRAKLVRRREERSAHRRAQHQARVEQEVARQKRDNRAAPVEIPFQSKTERARAISRGRRS
jgi:hypothetical protein